VPLPPHTIAVAGAAPPALDGPEAAKALKSQLERLTSAKAAIAGDSTLGHIAAGLEHQIQSIRAQLSAVQPLEVALRGTLGAVASARQALTRAEQKASKLEAQLVAALAAYDGASAEVQVCQKALADAEAATARTAGGRFDPRLLIGGHPGAALAILSEAAAARCVVGAGGVDAGLAARVQAAFAEVQNVCRLLPADVPAAPSTTTLGGATEGVSSAGAHAAGTPAEVPGSEATSGGAGQPRGGAPPAADPSAAAGPIQATSDQGNQQQQQLLVQQQAAQQLAHVQAVELAQHAQATLDQAAQCTVHQQAEAAAAAAAATATPVADSNLDLRDPGAAVQQASVASGGAGVGAQVGAGAGAPPSGGAVVVVPTVPPPRDDCMGGGANEGVANKRNAGAIESARVVAAKAKARAT
jgi:hypothetical protein